MNLGPGDQDVTINMIPMVYISNALVVLLTFHWNGIALVLQVIHNHIIFTDQQAAMEHICL